MKHSPITISAAVLGSVCIAYYFVCGIARSFSTSGLWIWLAFGLMLVLGVVWKLKVDETLSIYKSYRVLKRTVLILLAAFLLVFLVFEGFVIGKWIVGYGDQPASADAVLVLGATVEYDRPGSALDKRIDRAYDYHLENPKAVIIACGGLGEDDVITEADCIKRELTARGVPEELILTEDRSTSTAENFEGAALLLPEGMENIAVVTSGFHQFRAGILAERAFKKCGITYGEMIPVSAPCNSITLPCDMVREFAAFVKGSIG